MTDTTQAFASLPRAPMRAVRVRDNRYLYLLFFLLAGYAVLGRSFASLGAGSLYIGDLTLAIGLLVTMRSGCLFGSFAALPNLLLTVMMVWVVTRVVPNIGIYGLNALRDSVIVMYGLFAFVVVALLLEAPQRLAMIVNAYGRFIGFYAPISVFIGLVGLYVERAGTIPLVSVRPGELASHLAGAAVFALLGMRRVRLWWIVGLLAGIATLIPSRGGTIACGLAIVMAAVLGRRVLRLAPVLAVGLIVFVAAYASGIQIRTQGGRDLGPQQLVEGITSIFGASDTGNFDGTKEWRLHWWHTIEDYTFHGPYFWTGKGFGINLSEADGYVVGREFGGAPLRSPHSAHLSILARSGVPGLVLWVLTLGSWFAVMLANLFKARRRGDTQFADLFLWVACYLAAILVDASFDVALEGPMLGIWFWCLFGLGMGSVMIYRAALNTLPPNSRAAITLTSDKAAASPEAGQAP